MKRSPIVLLGTVAGVAGVLLLNPSGDVLMTTATTDGTGTTTANDTAAVTSTSQSATTPTTAPSPQGVSGTATGDAVFVRYGYVQLKVTAKNGTITDIAEVQMPDQDGRSLRITEQAGPMLKAQALKAQSANINGVSGATFTTAGYMQSLQSALDQLGF